MVRVGVLPKTGNRNPNTCFQVPSPSAEIDTGDDEFLVAGGDEMVDFLENLFQMHRAALAANIRNHAERAAVVASVLNFEVRASAFVGGVEYGRSEEIGVREDVGDEDTSFQFPVLSSQFLERRGSVAGRRWSRKPSLV